MALSFRRGSPLINLVAKTPYVVRQNVLGSAYMLVPRRWPGLLPLARVTVRDLPYVRRPLVPQVAQALDHPDGLCGLAGRIGPMELLEGYARGMFVMSHSGPLKWWAPRHRMVLFFDQARVEKTTRRMLRARAFRVTFDNAFGEVMRYCASPRSSGMPLTWITPRVRSLFEEAHVAGHAHSVEVWKDERLVGGIYGLAVGCVFFTESQFHTVRDASKVGFAVLNRHLQAWGFAMNDGKHPTRYLADAGMRPVTRAEFSKLTEAYCRSQARVGNWQVNPDLLDNGWEPMQAAGTTMAQVLPHGSTCTWSIDELLSSNRSPTW